MVGIGVVERVLNQVSDSDFVVAPAIRDGQSFSTGQVLVAIDANTRDLLTAERTILNLLTHLSGIATATAQWVNAVAGTSVEIRDSRKTFPGLRSLQKYAVLAGGGKNHRMGLADQAMIKDNHVVAAHGVTNALKRVRQAYPDLWCEAEVDSLAQLTEILALELEQVLLDNFGLEDVVTAVKLKNKTSPTTLLEASGGLTLEVAREYALAGVYSLAVGSLTHSVRAVDLGLDFLT